MFADVRHALCRPWARCVWSPQLDCYFPCRKGLGIESCFRYVPMLAIHRNVESFFDFGCFPAFRTNNVSVLLHALILHCQWNTGLLTIGPRFGGAIDDAARYFKDAHDRGLSPYEFVESMKKKGIRVPGIGHR